MVYRPTCHYAYHPANDAVLSLHEIFGATGKMQPKWHILDENEIVDGIDELGVLLYGHAKNAYWYGSQLSIEETRRLAPYQNATGLQVSSAVLAGMVWALENPDAGIVEADEMDFRRCLEIQRPYLGPVKGTTPTGRRSPTGPACSRKISTAAIPGSSATCWCAERSGVLAVSRTYFSLIGGPVFSAGAGGSAGVAPSFWACGSGRAALRRRRGRALAAGLGFRGSLVLIWRRGSHCRGCVACAICCLSPALISAIETAAMASPPTTIAVARSMSIL